MILLSKYTTQIRFIVEMNSSDNKPIGERIDESLPFIFNFNYPIWSEDYRRILERKIIMHYFNKEIGLETVGLWQLYLEERLNLIMPLYNEMYLTTSNKYDWLEDVNITETFDNTREGQSNINGTDNNNTINNGVDTTTSSLKDQVTQDVIRKNKSLNSDLPQANYQGLDYGTGLKEDEGEEKNNSTTNTSTTGEVKRNDTINSTNTTNTNTTSNTKDLYTKINKGLNGSRSKTQLNVEYRQSLINIDKMIIEELKDLFMMIY